MKRDAAAIVGAIELRGGRFSLNGSRLSVVPGAAVTPELRRELVAAGPAVVALLRERASDTRNGVSLSGTAPLVERVPSGGRLPAIAAPSALATESPALPPAPACELRWFNDWRPGQLVRLCCESTHRHSDAVPTFDAEEARIIVSWSSAEGDGLLDPAVRNLLFELKLRFGGRIDPESLASLADAV